MAKSQFCVYTASTEAGMGNMRTVTRLRPVRLGLGEISAFMVPE